MMNADAAMYRAKDLGSNNFQFYTREMNASVEEKLVLLEGLRRALDATLADEMHDADGDAPAAQAPAAGSPARSTCCTSRRSTCARAACSAWKR